VVRVELRPGHAGFEKSLRVGYGLAAVGRVRANGMPRNLLHAALMLKWGDGRLPHAYRLLEPILGLMAVIARRRNVDRMLERRYLSGTIEDGTTTSRLPSVKTLSQEHGVSHITVERAD
jgi:hypothetical protein